MSCESCREQMMELDVSQFEQLEHLEGCDACRAFADEIRAVEAAMGAHVEAFEQAGDFEADWDDARAEALETQEVPRPFRWAYVVAPLLAAVMVAAVIVPASLVLVQAPAPMPSPPVAPAPSPREARDTAVPRAPSPKPPARPLPRPRPSAAPAPSPAPSPAPAPTPAPPGATTSVRVDSEAYTGIEIACPSGFRQRASFLDGVARLASVPDEACTLRFVGGTPAVAEVRGGQDLTCTLGEAGAVCHPTP